MKISSKQYISEKLNELKLKFGFSSIRYRFENHSFSHFIQILPLSIFESEEYIIAETNLYNSFNELFPEEDLIFVSKGSYFDFSDSEVLFEEYKPSFIDLNTTYNYFEVGIDNQIMPLRGFGNYYFPNKIRFNYQNNVNVNFNIAFAIQSSLIIDDPYFEAKDISEGLDLNCGTNNYAFAA